MNRLQRWFLNRIWPPRPIGIAPIIAPKLKYDIMNGLAKERGIIAAHERIRLDAMIVHVSPKSASLSFQYGGKEIAEITWASQL